MVSVIFSFTMILSAKAIVISHSFDKIIELKLG